MPPVSKAKQREFIKKTMGLTDAQYKRKMKSYQKKAQLYNKAYELEGQKKVRASEILYGEAKAMSIYGKNYSPSARLKEFKSIQPTKGIRAARAALRKPLFEQFSGLIDVNETAQKVKRAAEKGQLSTAEAKRLLEDLTDTIRYQEIGSDVVIVDIEEEIKEILEKKKRA